MKKNWFNLSFLGVVAVGLMPSDIAISAFQKFPAALIMDGAIVGYFFLTGIEQVIPRPSMADLKHISIFTLSMTVMPWIGVFSLHILELLLFDPQHYFAFWQDLQISMLCCMFAPLTLASGTAITKMAGGDTWCSIFFCLYSHLFAIFYIPIVFPWLLVQDVDLNVTVIVIKLGTLMIAPFLLGALLCKFNPIQRIADDATTKKFIGGYSKALILILSYYSMWNSRDLVINLGQQVPYVLLFLFGVHLTMLAGNYFLSVVARMEYNAGTAMIFHGSQRGMTVPYLLSTVPTLQDFSGILIVPVLYHIIQTTSGLIIAQRSSAASSKALTSKPMANNWYAVIRMQRSGGEKISRQLSIPPGFTLRVKPATIILHNSDSKTKIVLEIGEDFLTVASPQHQQMMRIKK